MKCIDILTKLIKDYCDPNPCENNGICSKHSNGYTCSCQTNFTGKNCDKGR